MSYMSSRQAVILVIVISAIVRSILGATIGLGVDESYVVSVARTFSLSYFDHPPLHFWVIWLTTHLTNSENGLVLRFPFILMFAGTTWMMYRLTTRLFGEWAGFYAVFVLNISAVFSLSTGGWVLPDGPLMFLMMAATLVLEHLFFSPDLRYAWFWWLIAGLLVGIGMLAKYHAVFLAAGSFLFMLTTQKRRTLLLTPGPYLAVLVAALAFSPVVIWNQAHAWVSFLFQSGRGAAKGFYPLKMLGNIAGQAAWILPWIWGPLIWSLMKSIVAGPGNGKNSPVQDRQWFICCLASGPIFIFTLLTLGGAEGLFHWQAPGYLLALPLLGYSIDQWLKQGSTRVRQWLKISAIVYLSIIAILGSHTATGWICKVEPQWFSKGDPAMEAMDWDGLSEGLTAKGLLDDKATFVVTNHWIDAGKMDYALGGKYPVLCLNNQPHHFAFMYQLADFTGKDALIVGRKLTSEDIANYQLYFASVEEIGNVPIKRAGKNEFDVSVYYAKKFKGTFPLPYGQSF